MTPVRYMSIHHTDVGIYSHVYQTYGIPLPNGVVYTYTPYTNTSHGRGVYLHGGAGIRGCRDLCIVPHTHSCCV